MKKTRIVGGQSDFPDYEKQRLLHLEQNARIMEEKGYGSIANKILQQKAELLCNGVMNDALRNSGDKDANLKVKKQTMKHQSNNEASSVAFVNEPIQKQSQEQGLCSGSMAGYLKQKALKKKAQNSVQSREKQKAELFSKSVRSEYVHSANEEDCTPGNEGDGREGVMTDALQRNTIDTDANLKEQDSRSGTMADHLNLKALKKEAHTSVQSQTLKKQKHHVVEVEQHCLKRQKTQQSKRFCKPGSLSQYRAMRKKQVRNIRGDVVIEGHSENESENDFDKELELRSLSPERIADAEHQTGDNTDIVAPERESSPPVQPPKEATKSKKGRGPTRLTNVHARTKDERLVVVLNSYGQPIGPTAGEYTRFLGTLARDSVLAPITVCNWSAIDKDELWKYVKDKYLVSDEGRKWAMDTMNVAWRGHKCRTKSKVFTAQADSQPIELPKTVPNAQLNELIDYWNDSDVEEESKRNKRNRECLDDMHTMGPKSLALLRHKLQQADPNKEEPSLAKVYQESRKRDPKKTYKTDFSKTKANMEQMNTMESEQHEGGGPAHKDPYYEVVKKPEHNGRLRLFGKGVTRSTLKEKGTKCDYIFPQEFLQSVQMQVVKDIQEANPNLEIVIPDFVGGSSSRNPSSGARQLNETNGRSDCSATESTNHVQEMTNGLEMEQANDKHYP